MKKWYNFVVGCLLLVFCCCVGSVSTAEAAVSLNQTTTTVCVGGKTTLKINGSNKKVKWSSSNRRVAKVSSGGVVTGVKKGKAVITARTGGKKYTCRVTVNQTYGANLCSLSIRRNTSVTLTLTENSTVNYKIQNSKICGASWGSWSGNDIPLNIIPKKVGVTYITCSNKANNEIIKIRVRVTAVPVNITDMTVTTSDGGDLVCGLNTAKLSFRQDRASRNTVVYILSRDGEVIRTYKMGKLSKNRKYTVVWDGYTDEEKAYGGDFRMRIVADQYAAREKVFHTSYTASPFESGDGSSQLPYEVVSVEQLKKIKKFKDKYFIQTKDINLNYEIGDSMFTAERPFTGIYDGQGFEIQSYYGTASMFGHIGKKGVLKNLTLVDFSMNGIGDQDIAILAECNYGKLESCQAKKAFISFSNTGQTADAAFFVADNYGTIERCQVLEGIMYSDQNAGGIVVHNYGKVIGSVVKAEMHLFMPAKTEELKNLNAGGIAAVNDSAAFITRCRSDCMLWVSGELPRTVPLRMGGMVGHNLGQISNGSALSEIHNEMEGTAYIGLIVGNNEGNVTGVTYLQQADWKPCGTGSGRENGLISTQNVAEIPVK